jgi:hypothetical protein
MAADFKMEAKDHIRPEALMTFAKNNPKAKAALDQ